MRKEVLENLALTRHFLNREKQRKAADIFPNENFLMVCKTQFRRNTKKSKLTNIGNAEEVVENHNRSRSAGTRHKNIEEAEEV